MAGQISQKRGDFARVSMRTAMIGMDIQPISSCWFAKGEGQVLADMPRAGTPDLSVLSYRRIPLKGVNEGLSTNRDANRGFNQVAIVP
jgi:hypothetical protein